MNFEGYWISKVFVWISRVSDGLGSGPTCIGARRNDDLACCLLLLLAACTAELGPFSRTCTNTTSRYIIFSYHLRFLRKWLRSAFLVNAAGGCHAGHVGVHLPYGDGPERLYTYSQKGGPRSQKGTQKRRTSSSIYKKKRGGDSVL